MNTTETMLTRPDGWEEVGEVMSNFDGQIDREMEARLKSGPYVGAYPGWYFWAAVWWREEVQEWACEVKQYRTHVSTITAPTLDEVMEEVCRRYGYA